MVQLDSHLSRLLLTNMPHMPHHACHRADIGAENRRTREWLERAMSTQARPQSPQRQGDSVSQTDSSSTAGSAPPPSVSGVTSELADTPQSSPLVASSNTDTSFWSLRRAVKPSPSALSVMRVNQLDAGELDRQLHLLLAYQCQKVRQSLFVVVAVLLPCCRRVVAVLCDMCWQVVQYLPPQDLLTRFKPELDAFLHYLLYRFTGG